MRRRLTLLWFALIVVVVLLPDLEVVGMSDGTHLMPIPTSSSSPASSSPGHPGGLLSTRILTPTMSTTGTAPTLFTDADLRLILAVSSSTLTSLTALANIVDKFVIAPMHGTICAIMCAIVLLQAQRTYRALMLDDDVADTTPCAYCDSVNGGCGCKDDEFIQMYHRTSFSSAAAIAL